MKTFDWFKREKEKETIELYDHNDKELMVGEDGSDKSYYTQVGPHVSKIKEEFFSVEYKTMKNEKADNPRKNYVIGIEGGWGTGKSAFIERLLNGLSKDLSNSGAWYEKFNKNDNLIRIEAWRFSDKESLKEHIISQISKKVLDSDCYSFDDYNLFNKYSKSFTNASLLGHIVTVFRFLTLSFKGIIILTLLLSFFLMSTIFDFTSIVDIKAYIVNNIELLDLSY
ncbi:MAG TPA: hypothetical protein DCL21_01375, partial [Alphaproteobacteria bacterium]|nr:hypothetical protein [Alphaproteobacteria bacterium]